MFEEWGQHITKFRFIACGHNGMNGVEVEVFEELEHFWCNFHGLGKATFNFLRSNNWMHLGSCGQDW